MKNPALTPKEIRNKLGLTLEEVATAAGVSRSTILRSESKKRFSRIPMVAAAHRKALGLAP